MELVSAWIETLREHYGSRSRLRLDQALDLTLRFAESDLKRPSDLAGYLEGASVESARGPGVRVMTIHRAKGLEFDIVVMPELDRRLLAQASALYVERQSPLSPVDSVHRAAASIVRDSSPEIASAWERDRSRRLRDDLSALYVGLTRARSGLFLWTRASGREEQEPLGFGSILRQALADEVQERDASLLYARGERKALDGSGRGRQEEVEAPSEAPKPDGAPTASEATRVEPVVILESTLKAASRTVADLLPVVGDGKGGAQARLDLVAPPSRGLREAAAAALDCAPGELEEAGELAFAAIVDGRTVVGRLERVFWRGSPAGGVVVAARELGESPSEARRLLCLAAARRLAVPAAAVVVVAPDPQGAWRRAP